MTNAVTFIALKRTEEIVDDAATVAHVPYSDEELVALVREQSPKLFTVTASHAEQVLRRQPLRVSSYQEVSAEILERGKAPVPEKRVRTQRVGKSNGSNDVSRT